MRDLSLAWRALRRDWRSGELRVLTLALLIAVASVAAVGFFTDRIEQALERQSSELLGADLVLASPNPIAEAWAVAAEQAGLSRARTLSLRSVVLAGDNTQLAEVKAVSPGYPLRGRLQVSDAPYVPAAAVHDIPAPGTAWADERLLQALGIAVGDTLELGALHLRLTRVLAYEPDRGGDLFSIAPRLLVNLADIPATQLVQPGSRVEHRLLLAGPAQTVADFAAAAAARLATGEHLHTVRDARPELRLALERAARFLGLAAVVSVCLAGVGIAIAARRFATRHWDSVAVLRCFGASQAQVLRLYVLELLLLGGLGGLGGAALGYAAQGGLSAILAGLAASGALPPPSWQPLFPSLATGLIALLGFALPPLLRLRAVPPLRVLHRDLGPLQPRAAALYGPALAAVAVLLLWQAGELELAGYVLAGMTGTLLVLGLAAWALVRGLNRLRGRVGVAWRFGLANIARRRASSAVQVVALGLGIMVLLVLTLVRADLLEGWQSTLPPDAPNYFLINIQPEEVAGIDAFLRDRGLRGNPLHPMVRGRLTHIGGRAVSATDYENPRAQRLVEREFNLSWAEALQEDNKIVAGRWWRAQDRGQPRVSVEQGLAETLGIRLGDELRFNIVGQTLGATVTSLRTVQWDSFRVNFFVIFPPGVIENQPATWITSFYLDKARKPLLAELVRAFPSVTVLDVDALMGKVREIMERVTLAVEYVFLFTVLAGLTVLYAAIQATQDERRFEAAMLRTLGAQRRVVRASLLAEFALLGLLAGMLAAAAASALGYVLATQVFDFPYRFNAGIWLLGAAVGLLGVGAAGWLGARRVLEQPPLRTLREG
ncbi:MAG TPA: FtsX-like permease family protein [Candidatus Competibacteraceae bacterium]|nr:FtsX-like permease family protein [Candidatus Competibacteraceae bacterium]